jgi:sigma-B regulation protein RsbU (phosphoserine phosphatase)
VTGGLEQASGPETPEFFDALVEDDPAELYENAPCGYLSTWPDGTIIKVNQTFLTWTGYDRSELVGRRRLQELFTVGDRIFYETHYAPLLRMQGRVREIAVDLLLRDGTRLPVLSNAVLRRGDDGEPQVIRTVLFDARERRAYERELLAARGRAEAAEARARQLAQTLQATFLPPVALVIPGLDVGGMYRPAGDGDEVGGDFYDVFATGRGTHAVVLGDVSGKGAAAAVVTALARHVVRGEMAHRNSPAEVLEVLHHAIRQAHPDRFCTAVLMELAVGEEVTATIAVAGHPLPIRTSGSRTGRVGQIGSMLGMLDGAQVQDESVILAPGEVLLLFTDGVTEARSGDREFFGEGRVEALAEALAREPASDIAAAVVEAAISFQDGQPRDDIAVVALRLPLVP